MVVAPKAGGKTLALAVAPLKGLTADEAKLEPDEVQRAIRKALKKALGKTVEQSSKPPASGNSLESAKARGGGIGSPGRASDQALQREW